MMILSNCAAIYLRLSRDDGGIESESIASQRMLLEQYARTHGMLVSAEFIDDGISGSRWDRNGLQQMLRAIEDGWIGTVLVKDLSRLSRDYIRTGELLERWFPSRGVRLIAVDDGVDTGVISGGNDYSAIRAVMDDWYARDISNKVRSAIYARQRAGICTAATLPYGYCRAGKEIVLRTAHSEQVRRIFDMCLSGSHMTEIAQFLTNQGVAAPAGGTVWNDRTIGRILRNPAYIGRLPLHKTVRHSYKCGKRHDLSSAVYIYYPVPPIVAEDSFSSVQTLLDARAHKDCPKHWLSGRVTCGICGRRMRIAKEGSGYRLICGGRKSGTGCENLTCRVTALLHGIAGSLTNAGILLPESVFPMLIERITLSADTAEVFLRYALPHPVESV